MGKNDLISSSLFHFTKDLDTLKKILASAQVKASYCTEHYWGNVMFAFPMASFCDIPLRLVDRHMSVFGKYGIGLSRSWAKRVKSISPVIYLLSDSYLEREVKNILKEALNSKRELSEAEKLLISHVKKYSGRTCDDRYKTKGNVTYYEEREWRYIPKKLEVSEVLIEKEDKSSLKAINTQRNMSENGNKFKTEEITWLIVDDEDDREELCKFLTHMKSKLDGPRIKSRIITNEQIQDL